MIIECYSSDVYCDVADHPYGTIRDANNPEICVGQNKTETDRTRRKRGWRRIAGYDVCPQCAAWIKANPGRRVKWK